MRRHARAEVLRGRRAPHPLGGPRRAFGTRAVDHLGVQRRVAAEAQRASIRPERRVPRPLPRNLLRRWRGRGRGRGGRGGRGRPPPPPAQRREAGTSGTGRRAAGPAPLRAVAAPRGPARGRIGPARDVRLPHVRDQYGVRDTACPISTG